MYTERQLTICERICEHCREHRWYGPDALNPKRDWVQRAQRYDRDSGTWVRCDVWDDSRLLRFEYPPASAAELNATEAALGYALPPMLRALFSEVANGGFGPGLGITGARGGYSFEYDDRDKTLDQYAPSSSTLQYFDLPAYEALHGMTTHLLLPPKLWPAHFLPLVYWGCATDTYIDAVSGRVYYTGCWDVVETELDVEAFMSLSLQEVSLEDWLEAWLYDAEHKAESSLRHWFNDPPIVNYIPPDSLV